MSPSFGRPSAINVCTESTASCHLLLEIIKVVSSLISKPNLLIISCSPAKPSVVSIYISSKYESSNLLNESSPSIKSLFTNVRGIFFHWYYQCRYRLENNG